MRPWLFRLGETDIHSYYVFLALGFIAAILLGLRECRRADLDPVAFIELSFVIVISGIFGARLMHVIAESMPHDFFYSATLHKGAPMAAELVKKGAVDVEKIAGYGEPIIKFYARFPAQIFYLWKGGMAFYGGLILATISAIAFMIIRKMPVLKTSDIIGLGLPLGLVFGRIGCFLNGCCFGSETHGLLGISFPRGSAAFAEMKNAGIVQGSAGFTPPVLPAMLFEAAACLAIFLFLYFYVRPRKRFDGQMVMLFGMFYPVCRFVIEFFRNDNRGVFFGGVISSSQIVSLAVFIFSITAYLILRQRHASHSS